MPILTHCHRLFLEASAHYLFPVLAAKTVCVQRYGKILNKFERFYMVKVTIQSFWYTVLTEEYFDKS